LAVAVCGGVAAACVLLTGRTAQAPLPLRVMSYNIQAAEKGLNGIVEAIRTAAPDLIALQEVDVRWAERSHFADEPEELAGRLGMAARFAEIYRLPSADASAPPREFGVALLSAYPISAFHNVMLTRLSTQDSSPVPHPAPGLLDARVELRGVTVRVLNTHLDYRADPAVRMQQVREMLDAIGALTTPTIVFGDMNAAPDAPELAPLLARLRDAWPTTAGPGFTYPSEKPAKRIDYVLVSPHFRVMSATVPPVAASDHRPVVVDLALTR
jgi:endonuclease/exonuclease/phosphatase family metal-dependent hydrolase